MDQFILLEMLHPLIEDSVIFVGLDPVVGEEFVGQTSSVQILAEATLVGYYQ